MIASESIFLRNLKKTTAWNCFHFFFLFFEFFKIFIDKNVKIFLNAQRRFDYGMILFRITKKVSEFLNNSFDLRSMLRIPDQNTSQKVNKNSTITIFFKFFHVLFC